MVRFIVDVNVGHLARKLRMLGYDARFVNPVDDAQLLRLAREENRVIISGDRGIFQIREFKSGKASGLFVQVNKTTDAQVAEIIHAFRLRPRLSLQRCIQCNTPLVRKGKEEAEGRVPPFVQKTARVYRYCPRCDQFFWEGDHVKRMREMVERLQRDSGGS